jgi:hypothetical protein
MHSLLIRLQYLFPSLEKASIGNLRSVPHLIPSQIQAATAQCMFTGKAVLASRIPKIPVWLCPVFSLNGDSGE